MDNIAQKTKVLFVITKSNWGGAQKYVYDLATNLPEEQFAVSVALGGSGSLIQKLHTEHIRVLPIFSLSRDVNPWSDITAFFELWKMFREEKPDVVHLNSAKAGGVGALAARLAGVPKIIFTAHGWAFNEERSLWQKLIIKFFSWVTIMLSHQTIAVSNAIKNDVRNWPCVSRKVSVVKNGAKEQELLSREGARERLFARVGTPVRQSALIIGTIAELHKSKGTNYAIEAFAKLAPQNPNLYYFIIGAGEEKDRLKALVERHKLQGRVFLLGFIEDAPRFLRAFDLFLIPSITEALGYVLLEAGLAGLPVVASRVGGIPEIIEDGKTGLLVPSRNADALHEALLRLIDSPDLRDSFGVALKQRVADDFSLKTMISQTTVLYS